jgi:hypothetical protein
VARWSSRRLAAPADPTSERESKDSSTMGALGAVGGAGGGLSGGTTVASASTGWFDASSVMSTTGNVSGTKVSLGDGDLHGGAGANLHKDPVDRFVPVSIVHPPAPLIGAGVVSQVVACYAANRLQG